MASCQQQVAEITKIIAPAEMMSHHKPTGIGRETTQIPV